MGWRISSQQASKRFNESFLAIARDNEGIWLPIDPHMFLTLQADQEAPRQYTYRGFVQGGHWHSLPNEYVRHFFTTELLRRCKASCGKPISCSDAGQAAPGGGEASDADVATAESAVVGPPIAYPQHEMNDYCVAYSAASGLHAADDADSAASVARLAPQMVGLPAGNDRVQWLTHHLAQQLQPHWETRKLKSVGAARRGGLPRAAERRRRRRHCHGLPDPGLGRQRAALRSGGGRLALRPEPGARAAAKRRRARRLLPRRRALRLRREGLRDAARRGGHQARGAGRRGRARGQKAAPLRLLRGGEAQRPVLQDPAQGEEGPGALQRVCAGRVSSA